MLRLFGALNQETDYERWSDKSNIDAAWESRTERAAALVPNGSRVIEFGAANRILEKHLDPSCTYVPCDLVDRGPGTIVCDLNERPLPDLGTFDVAVIMGVLEYVRDVPSMLDWLVDRVSSRVLLSYACAKRVNTPLVGKLAKGIRLNRGWMNDYTDEEIRALFAERGFAKQEIETWKAQRMYQFSR